jgi:hypothetical protein
VGRSHHSFHYNSFAFAASIARFQYTRSRSRFRSNHGFPRSTTSGRLHNKSGSSTLSLLEESKHSHQRILEYHRDLISKTTNFDGLCENSPCKRMSAADGRYTKSQVKVAYGYQIVAYVKFGRDTMLTVPTAKLADDPLISHLCGTLNCCEASHMVIEHKRINDERTHCHFCMRGAKAKNG